MPNSLVHFAINADDIERARKFYAAVFGWNFDPWGPPGFFNMDIRHEVLKAAMQKRREIVPGVPMRGFECTISVDDVAATASAVESNGGKIVMPVCAIPTVGQLCFFEDTEGNIVGAIQFE